MKLFKILKRFEAVLIFITVLLSAQIVRADEYTYDDNGRITQVEHEDGSSTVYSYDDNGNLLSVETVSPTKKENPNNNNTNENQSNIPSDNKEQEFWKLWVMEICHSFRIRTFPAMMRNVWKRSLRLQR